MLFFVNELLHRKVVSDSMVHVHLEVYGCNGSEAIVSDVGRNDVMTFPTYHHANLALLMTSFMLFKHIMNSQVWFV